MQGTAGCKVRGERSDLRAGQERSVVDGVNVFGERGSVEDPRAMASAAKMLQPGLHRHGEKVKPSLRRRIAVQKLWVGC